MIDLEDEEVSSSLQDAMTPMIDVIFVIIAFMMLMINVPLLTMEVELPKAVEKPTVANVQKNVVSIGVVDGDDAWLVNDARVFSIDSLKERLIEQKLMYPDQLSVVIHSDKQVPMERVVALFGALQELELNVSHLALQQ
ncbi:biopolymer transporter ExbD [Vibrio sp. D404a]|jgi:biopolymer transport protein ExbD|uniref:ExbD/TolR family protein n=1 Tax=unclassified Vibrio TaxID=2614977 RepID=UPI0025569352|nr:MULTISPECIES: biopolymer transporter ExbD [unclassified Vibrio]MDK9737229.1 biopolymer transporter ExbD [Vibrio sp. D404a]MDK9762443.1 biopolymer transporter ExbD [Vibrio sp. D420a]MDK9797116.1 biopolymer transporter ExbD [Vibrio sp. D449a]